MPQTISEIRVWSCTTSSDRELLEKWCNAVAEKGGSFKIEYLGTRSPDNFTMQRYTINWPEGEKK